MPDGLLTMRAPRPWEARTDALPVPPGATLPDTSPYGQTKQAVGWFAEQLAKLPAVPSSVPLPVSPRSLMAGAGAVGGILDELYRGNARAPGWSVAGMPNKPDRSMLVSRLGPEKVNELEMAMDDTLAEVSDASRSRGRALKGKGDLARWIHTTDAEAVSSDPEWHALLQEARSVLPRR